MKDVFNNSEIWKSFDKYNNISILNDDTYEDDNIFIGDYRQKKKAINNTEKLLNENNIKNYTLFNESHENIDNTLKDYKNKVSLFIFNLGYLPNGNKEIMTYNKSTLNALKKAFNMLNNKGIILIVFYPHTEGKKEYKSILKYLKENNIKFNEYHNTDNTNAPFLVEIKNSIL